MYHNISHILQVMVLSIVDVPHPDYLEYREAPNLDLVVFTNYVSIPSPLLTRMPLIYSIDSGGPPIQVPLSKVHQVTSSSLLFSVFFPLLIRGKRDILLEIFELHF